MCPLKVQDFPELIYNTVVSTLHDGPYCYCATDGKPQPASPLPKAEAALKPYLTQSALPRSPLLSHTNDLKLTHVSTIIFHEKRNKKR